MEPLPPRLQYINVSDSGEQAISCGGKKGDGKKEMVSPPSSGSTAAAVSVFAAAALLIDLGEWGLKQSALVADERRSCGQKKEEDAENDTLPPLWRRRCKRCLFIHLHSCTPSPSPDAEQAQGTFESPRGGEGGGGGG